jgi:hypothetical protein
MDRRALDETKEQETCECEENEDSIIREKRTAKLFGQDLKNRDMKKDIAQGKFLQEKDQICRNCNKRFMKSANSSWSCSYHPNKWNGFIYSCCGKSNKFSPGCITSKHYWVETEEKQWQGCLSCKNSSHLTKDCPQDPNLRTGANPTDELDRIRRLQPQRSSQRLRTGRAYKNDDDGFKDINRLKIAIQEKNRGIEGNLWTRSGSSENKGCFKII